MTSPLCSTSYIKHPFLSFAQDFLRCSAIFEDTMSPLYSNKASPFLKPRFVNMPYPVDKQHNFQNQKSKFCLSEDNNTPLGLTMILTMIRQFFFSCHPSTPSTQN